MTTPVPAEPTFVVTLVHGTRVFPWQSKVPDWALEGSPLRIDLNSKLHPVIRAFPWTGGNSMRARSQATKALAEFLRDGLAEYPSARHFVIAHSHGGNVAMHAVCGSDLEGCIRGVVCMATPFLHVHPHAGSDFGKLLAAMAYWTGPFIISLSFVFGIGVTWDEWRPKTWTTWEPAITVGLLVATCVLFAVLIKTKRVVSAAIARWVTVIVEANRWPDLIATRLLIVRGVADEASGVLIATQFSHWLFRTLAMIVDVPRRRVLPETPPVVVEWFSVFAYLASRVILYVGGLALILFWFYALIHDWFANAFEASILLAILAACLRAASLVVPFLPAILAFAIGLTLRGCLTVIAAIAGIPFALISMILMVAFGRDLILSSPWLDISAETTPPGDWPVYLLNPSSAVSGLRHSIYDDPRAIFRITEWLAESSPGVLDLRTEPAAAREGEGVIKSSDDSFPPSPNAVLPDCRIEKP